MDKKQSAFLALRIAIRAVARTADLQRWTWRRIVSNLALLGVMGLLAWASGRLDAIASKSDVAVLGLGAIALLFLIELIPQLFIATYNAGLAASGDTASLKRLYRLGLEYKQYIKTVTDDELELWREEVSRELGKALPMEQFGFDTVSDDLEPSSLMVFIPVYEENDRIHSMRLKKLRAILMRADKVAEDT